MMSTTNVSTTSDAGPTQNKLQRPSVGNQAEDGLSTTGRKPNEVANDPIKSDQTNKSGKRSRNSVGTTAPEAKRTNTGQDYGQDSWVTRVNKFMSSFTFDNITFGTA